MALAGGAAAVPLGPVNVAYAQTQLVEYEMKGSAGSNRLLDDDWVGGIALPDGVYTPYTIQSARLIFKPGAGRDRGFPEIDTYKVRVIRGRDVIQDYGELVGYGGNDGAGTRWLDVDLPTPAEIKDGYTLQFIKESGAWVLPIRSGFSEPGPEAIGYGAPRFAKGSLSGAVKAEDGTALPDAKVQLVDPKGESTPLNLGNNGTFSADNLAVGDYTLRVTPPNGYEAPAARTVSVTAGSNAEVGAIVLKRQKGTLDGRVAGLPAGAKVTVSVDGDVAKTVETGDNGAFSFAALPTGSYAVTVKGVPAGYRLTESSKSVAVPATGAQASFSVTRETGTVSGRVTDPSGKGVEGVQIKIGTKVTATEPDGTYSLSGVPTGAIRIEVGEGVPAGYAASDAQQRNVTTAGVSGVDFSLTRLTGTVSGKVTGLPEGAQVTVVAGGKTAKTQPDGSYEIANVPTGSTKVEVTGGVPAGYSVSGAQQKDVTTGGATADFSVTVDNVTGTVKVVDDAGKPVSGADVKLSNGKSATTNADGVATFAGLAPGSYTATVASGSGYSGTSGTLKLVPATGGEVTLEVGSLNQVSGTVVDDLGDPVSGAQVEIKRGETVVKTVPADDNGRFDAGVLAAGSYSAQVKAGQTYEASAAKPFTVEAGRGTDSVVLEVPLIKGGLRVSVSGPVDAASVEVSGGPENISKAVSKTNGAYSLSDLYPGSYTVTVKAPENYSVDQQLRTVEVKPGETPSAAFVLTADDGSVGGLVVDGGGNAVPGTKVDLIDPKTDAVVGTGTADENGNVDIPGVRPGDYTVRVTPPAGYNTPAESTVIVEPGQAATIPAITATRQTGSVSGRVSGLPEGVQVTVKAGDKSATTRPDGTYTIDGLPTGSYSVAVVGDLPGYSASPAQHKDVTTAGAKADFQVTRLTGSVTGSVTDKKDNPVPNVQVMLVDASGNSITASTDKEGVISAEDVPTGEYYVDITAQGYFPANAKVAVEENTPAQVEIRLERQTGTITGLVTGLPKDTTVTVTAGDKSVSTNPDGTYEITDLPTGNYSVAVDGVPQGYSVSAAQQTDVTTAGASADFQVTRQTGSVTGRVLDNAGNPIANTQVVLIGAAGTTIRAAIDAEGNVTADDVPTGQYTVEAYAQGYVPSSETVTVEADVPARFGQIALNRQTATVSGRVTGLPEGAKVTVTAGDNSATTRPDGTYEIAGVPTGSTTVEVSSVPEGYTASASQQTDVTAEGATADFSLTRQTGSATGTVVSDSEQAVSNAQVMLIDASGNAISATTDENGDVRFEDVPTGQYTVEVSAEGYVPERTNVTVQADSASPIGPLTLREVPEPEPTPEPEPESEPDVFEWEPVVVQPGDVVKVPVTRTGSGASDVTFDTGAVSKVKDDGSTEIIEDAGNWVQVQEDGTVVAAPPSDTAPGEYRVEVVGSNGERDTVTVMVAPLPPMSQRYDVVFPEYAVRAGMKGQTGAPRARVTEGKFVYPDRALPAGTKFEVDHPWATVDQDGRVIATPPAGIEPGMYEIGVTVNLPDGSFKDVTAIVEVSERQLSDIVLLGYEDGLSVRPGKTVTVFRTGAQTLPEGTSFAVDSGAQLDGWAASVDARTGTLRITAPSNAAADAEIPVTAYFTDGSSTPLQAAVRLSTSSALAAANHPTYDKAQGTIGTAVTVQVAGDLPDGTAFALVDGGGLDVAVDPATGAIRVIVPEDAALDETYTATVRVMYPDGSTDEVPAPIDVVSNATLFGPGFIGGVTTVGQTSTMAPASPLPPGTTFDVDGFGETGWSAEVDPNTGRISVRTDGTVPVGQEVKVPVRMTYPDGSTEVVEVPFTAAQQQAEGEVASQGSSGSSVSTGWLVVLLGALAAVTGIGYAVFVNQDQVKALLNNYGIRM